MLHPYRLKRSLSLVALLLLTCAAAHAAPAKDLPDGLRSGTIDGEAGSIFYEVAGTGEPLVLIHDGLLHREIYENQFAPFAKHFTVVRYDRRGYGRSTTPRTPYSNIDDLLRILDEMKIGKASLVGMSAGGGLAVDFTLAHPDRVKALVLVGAVVSGLGYSDHFLTRGGHMTAAHRTDTKTLGRFYTLEDPYEIAPENAAAKERAWALLEANLNNIDRGRHGRSQPPPRPALENLGEIGVPTLILIGEHDIPDVHAHGGALEAGIPNARRVLVPGAGHLVPLERPEEFTTAVLNFLRGAEFFVALQAGDAAGAAAAARRLREKDPEFVPIPENDMNAAGYRLLFEGKADQAVEIFRLNTELHPDSWNVWDSLGEGLAAVGEIEAAIEAYRKSVALNPENNRGFHEIQELMERRRKEGGTGER